MNIPQPKIVGICISCKKQKPLIDFAGLKMCKECEDKYYDELIDKHEKDQYGKDLVNDEKLKKKY